MDYILCFLDARFLYSRISKFLLLAIVFEICICFFNCVKLEYIRYVALPIEVLQDWKSAAK